VWGERFLPPPNPPSDKSAIDPVPYPALFRGNFGTGPGFEGLESEYSAGGVLSGDCPEGSNAKAITPEV